MLFNSIEFLLFLPIIFILYWFVFNKNLKIQNTLILLSSYLFYGWWDYRFLSLIFLSTIVDYIIGLNIPKQDSKKKQKLLLWCSVLFNLSVLGFFKYYNFFVDSWIDLFSSVGYEIKSVWTLNIILPVGISFYTFQTMSYTIDICRKKLEPTKDFISFASFVSFFPQLVAGPIERASNLLPQILKKREFNVAYDQKFNPMFVKDLKKIVFLFLKKKFQGTYNVGGNEKLTRFDCLKKINFFLKKKIKNTISLNKKELKIFNYHDKRPLNVTFNTKKINNKLNFKMTKFDTIAKKMIKKYKINEKIFD